jgi:hypothetical protein
VGLELSERAFFVSAHEAALTGYVSGQDRCESPLYALGGGQCPLQVKTAITRQARGSGLWDLTLQGDRGRGYQRGPKRLSHMTIVEAAPFWMTPRPCGNHSRWKGLAHQAGKFSRFRP